jgi:hypothetical protein
MERGVLQCLFRSQYPNIPQTKFFESHTYAKTQPLPMFWPPAQCTLRQRGNAEWNASKWRWEANMDRNQGRATVDSYTPGHLLIVPRTSGWSGTPVCSRLLRLNVSSTEEFCLLGMHRQSTLRVVTPYQAHDYPATFEGQNAQDASSTGLTNSRSRDRVCTNLVSAMMIGRGEAIMSHTTSRGV